MSTGAFETIKLNMSKLIWSVTTKVSQRHPLASEVFVRFLLIFTLFSLNDVCQCQYNHSKFVYHFIYFSRIHVP